MVVETFDLFDESTFTSIFTIIKIDYFTPVLSYRNYTNNRKMQIQTNVGIGYIQYIDDNIINGEWLLIKGQTIGLNVDIIGSFMLSENLGINVYGSVIYGKLSKMTIDSQIDHQEVKFAKSDKENVGRYEVGIGITWAIFNRNI